MRKFPKNNNIDLKEIVAVRKVLETGVLSDFVANTNDKFFGGKEVINLEKKWSKYFKSKYSITTNSWSTGIQTIIGALELGPGDEIIMPPFTMTSCAAVCLFYGVVPVFVDIEKDYFCIDPKKIEEKITKKTKAIMAVNLFGQSCDYTSLKKICSKHKLILIEDNAQAIGAKYKGKFLGTIGDIGGFSLNYHKHIHCGEGGIITTNNKKYYQKSTLIRNHGEYCHSIFKNISLVNVVGNNFRLVEISAAIAQSQLLKLKNLLKLRVQNSHYLIKNLKKIKCIHFPGIRKNSTHSFYLIPFIYNKNVMKCKRETFVNFINNKVKRKNNGENILASGYVKPIYKQDIYIKKIGIGKKKFPFENNINYKNEKCNVAEKMYSSKLILLNSNFPKLTKMDLNYIINVFLNAYKKFKK